MQSAGVTTADTHRLLPDPPSIARRQYIDDDDEVSSADENHHGRLGNAMICFCGTSFAVRVESQGTTSPYTQDRGDDGGTTTAPFIRPPGWWRALILQLLLTFMLAIYVPAWVLFERDRARAYWAQIDSTTTTNTSSSPIHAPLGLIGTRSHPYPIFFPFETTIPCLCFAGVALLLYLLTGLFLMATVFRNPGVVPRRLRNQQPPLPPEVFPNHARREHDDEEAAKKRIEPIYASPEEFKESEGLEAFHPTEVDDDENGHKRRRKVKIESWETVLANGTTVTTMYCSRCKSAPPWRSAHCDICDNCVEDFDHHCSIIGACIGRRNIRDFLFFILFLALLLDSTFVGSVFCLYLNWTPAAFASDKVDPRTVTVRAAGIVFAVLVFLFGLWVSLLNRRYWRLVSRDGRTAEEHNQLYPYRGFWCCKKLKQGMDDPTKIPQYQQPTNPFDRGSCLRNYGRVCCPTHYSYGPRARAEWVSVGGGWEEGERRRSPQQNVTATPPSSTQQREQQSYGTTMPTTRQRQEEEEQEVAAPPARAPTPPPHRDAMQ